MNGETDEGRKYYGKYSGTVMNNIDPMQQGRLQVQVPDVLSLVPSSWAQPCVPLAGPPGTQMGLFLVPPIGTGVWVEFEGGDPDRPIWTGCRWPGTSGVPVLALAGLPVSPNLVLQSSTQHAIMISDLPGPTGGILLKTATGALIAINDIGITISNGKGASIVLTGPTVTVNQGALVVT